MDMQLYDNYEDDGQLSMFDMGEDVDGMKASASESVSAKAEMPSSGSAGVRIRRCSSCGKLLYVKEENGCYNSACNACGIRYMQRI